MKALFVILLLVIAPLRLSAQTKSENYDHVQVGFQTGLMVGAGEVFPVVQFNFSGYSPEHWGFYLEPSIGLEGWNRHQILGSIHYIISGGLVYTVTGRSAILGGYSWGGRYDGIQFSDPQNRRYYGPWIGLRLNFPDGVFVPHGNFSVMGRFMPLTVEELPGGETYHQKYVMLTFAYNCDW